METHLDRNSPKGKKPDLIQQGKGVEYRVEQDSTGLGSRTHMGEENSLMCVVQASHPPPHRQIVSVIVIGSSSWMSINTCLARGDLYDIDIVFSWQDIVQLNLVFADLWDVVH